MKRKPEGRRSAGRPKLRWKDGVVEDIMKLGIKSLCRVARDGQSWKKALRKAEARIALQS
jgi:hypothetical protein